jgi:GDP-4-dehydro-6-deoxy-D-mannose reductase
MHPERLLITGANGFVGRHLILHLLGPSVSKPPRIKSAVLPGEMESAATWTSATVPHENQGQIGWCAADITTPGAAELLLREFEPDAIVHLAARASGADSDRDAVFKVNVEGSRTLLEAAARRPMAPRTLLISTGYAYGPTSVERPAVETDPLATPGIYGAYTDSKIAMERLAGEFSNTTIIVRSFSHTGPGQTPAFAVPSFARQLARIENGIDPPTIMVGNLEALRDMLDVRDVVRAYWLILQQGAAGEVYNVASGHPYRMRNLLEYMIEQISLPVEVVEDPARLRPADIACSTGDSAKLTGLTCWQPAIPIERTLKDTLDFWRKSQ